MLGFGNTWRKLHQKVRVHNYEQTMASQVRVTETAQLQQFLSEMATWRPPGAGAL